MSDTWAIIQARMGSTRLRGKVMMDIAGKPMLHHVIERTLDATAHVIVATTYEPQDDAIADASKHYPVRVFRGSPIDVLSRYIAAAREVEATRIVRITADCPMLDPDVVRRVIDACTLDVDYASNLYPRTYPKGLDCECFWFDTLLRLDRISESYEREHVTAAIGRCPQLFRLANVHGNYLLPNWSVDTAEDLDRVRKLHEALQPMRSA